MRFNKNNLSYYIQEDCTLDKRDSMKGAFSIISEETGVIYFYELSNEKEEPEIIIKCSESSMEIESDQKNKRTFIAGEGGPTKFLDLYPYSLIIQGEIQLYSSRYQTKCSEPLVELHELLHVFGYDHIADKESILYPYLSCNQELKQNIVQDLIELYSEPAKAELSIADISASKSGRYLNFYIEIKNTGLIDTENVTLDVSTGDKLIKSFPIEELNPGLMRSLNLTNLQLPSNNIENITFKVISKTPEYSTENNFVEMSIKK